MNEAEFLMKNYGDRGECYPSKGLEFNNCFIIYSK